MKNIIIQLANVLIWLSCGSTATATSNDPSTPSEWKPFEMGTLSGLRLNYVRFACFTNKSLFIRIVFWLNRKMFYSLLAWSVPSICMHQSKRQTTWKCNATRNMNHTTTQQMLSISWWKLEMSSHLWQRKLHFHQMRSQKKTEKTKKREINVKTDQLNLRLFVFNQLRSGPVYCPYGIASSCAMCQRSLINKIKLKRKLDFSSHRLFRARNYSSLSALFRSNVTI